MRSAGLRAVFFAPLWAALAATLPAVAEPATQQTIVVMRHAERAAGGLGQLDCQGLNRSLAIPAMLARRFGRPDFLFAPSPSFVKQDFGTLYSYVRPLATIEPTAIRFGLPLDATIGYAEVDKLQRRLEDPALRKGLTVVAWEHAKIVELARNLMRAHGADAGAVPDWNRNDFDSLYVLHITRGGNGTSATFEHTREELDGLPKECRTR